MRRASLTILTMLATTAPGILAAQVNDLALARCSHFLDMRPAEAERLALWLHGYYAGAAQRTAVDARQFESAIPKLREACGKRPDLPLISAEARAILLGLAPLEPEPPAQPPFGTSSPLAPRRGP